MFSSLPHPGYKGGIFREIFPSNQEAPYNSIVPLQSLIGVGGSAGRFISESGGALISIPILMSNVINLEEGLSFNQRIQHNPTPAMEHHCDILQS